jgi:hypothetical protein
VCPSDRFWKLYMPAVLIVPKYIVDIHLLCQVGAPSARIVWMLV